MADPHKNLWYNKKLRDFAHENRSGMTKAEACLWKYVLSGRRMCGYQFRRQRPVLNYIADFMCKELMLIIEVDGITHEWEKVAENDKIRSEALKAVGFTVLRFDDEDVLNGINGVYYQIEDFIREFELRDNLDTHRGKILDPPPTPASGGHWAENPVVNP